MMMIVTIVLRHQTFSQSFLKMLLIVEPNRLFYFQEVMCNFECISVRDDYVGMKVYF